MNLARIDYIHSFSKVTTVPLLDPKAEDMDTNIKMLDVEDA